MAVPETPNEWNYIHKVGFNLRSTLNDLSAVFSPACIEHEVITNMDWTEVVVDGVSLPDALNCWAESLEDRADDVIDDLNSGNKISRENTAALKRQR